MEKSIHGITNFDYPSNSRRYTCKKPRANNIICRLLHRGKMEQILHAYGLPKENITAIMMLYKNTKVKVRSPDGDTNYFDIVAGVLQGDTLATYLFIICLDYGFRTSIDKMKDNGFKLTKERSRRYPAQKLWFTVYVNLNTFLNDRAFHPLFFLNELTIYNIRCLNIHGTHMTVDNFRNNNVEFFFSDLKIVNCNNYYSSITIPWTRKEKYFASLLIWRQNHSKLSQNRCNPLI